jgi:acyl-CoA ligase (AMP-forming) (exosortase A-associated)
MSDRPVTEVAYSLCDVLMHQSRGARSSHTAISDGVHRISYAALCERALGYASVLKAAGVNQGDRVAVFLPRSAEAAVALFATWFAGGVAVVINERLRSRQVHHIVEHSEATAILTDTRQLASVSQCPRGRVINIDEVPPAAAGPAEAIIGADLALLIYTSGSTGLPKGVMVTHDNLRWGAKIVADYLHLTDQDVILSVLPFSFDYGLNQLLTAILVGGTLVIQRSLLPRDICETLKRERITGLPGVPMLWLQLCGQHSPFLKTGFPPLRYLTNTGGHLPEHAVRQIRTAHPDVQIYLMYGLTEAFRSTFLPPDEVDRRPSSIGKAIPNVEILVINEAGNRCEPGEVGELVHRGATVSRGYWRDPDSTAGRFRPHPIDGRRIGNTELVVFSGDLVKTDTEGYLYYVGRKDKLMKSRGVRVSPEEIESCIYASALVSHVVSFSVPRGEGDNDLVVAVVPSDAARFCEVALQEFCKNEMPEYMWPHVVWTQPAFPLTTSGKPDRCRIEEMYVEHCQAAATAARAARAS